MSKLSLPYRILKRYIRFWTESVYYDETFVQGVENIPSDGTPVMIASNHQNSMNDALGVLLAVNDRKPNFIVRADVFAIHPVVGKFLRSIGLLPAYRLNYEGSGAIAANASTFSMSEEALIEGETVVIFPEGGHAEGHWLNAFKGGMAKMAFEAAQIADFEKDIKIVPACNHYSSYHGLKGKVLVRFGEPVSVAPYYELYKTKPRTAMRQLTAEVRSRIAAMVLDVKDKEFYDEIEYIRSSEYGDRFAKRCAADGENYEQRFESDKKLIGELFEARKAEDPAFHEISSDEGDTAEELKLKQLEECGEPCGGPVASVLKKASQLLVRFKEMGISESQMQDSPEIFLSILKTIALIVLFPLALFCLWPTIICRAVPKYLSDRAKGDMFEGTFLIALNVLIIIPITAILTFIIAALRFTAVFALIYVLLFPLIFLFEWKYVCLAKEVRADFRYFAARKSGELGKVQKLRQEIFSDLDSLLK